MSTEIIADADHKMGRAVEARPVRIPPKSRAIASTARPIFCSTDARVSLLMRSHLPRWLP